MKPEIVEKDVRFYNFIIDVFIIIIMCYIMNKMLDLSYSFYQAIFFQGVYYGYYFIMEYSFHKTVGKMVTNTVVIHKTGREPSLANLIIRTAFRIATLDFISFALGTKIGMHDLMSNTRVVRYEEN